MIIDCHTHAYPMEVIQKPRVWAEERGEHHWADLVAPLERPSIQGWSDPQRMLAYMDAAGVDLAVLLGWYWEHAETCRWHNDVMADWIQIAPERFKVFASVYPDDSLPEQLEAAKALGFCGVGEIHLGVQPWHPQDDHWGVLAEWCLTHDWPINLHVTEAAGQPQPGSVPTPLQAFVDIAQRHPNLKLILAHWGGGLPFFALNPKLRPALRNVYYDTAASPLLYDSTVFRWVADLVGADRILYGSDFPLRLYPRSQCETEMSHFIEEIRFRSGLGPAELAQILGGNAQRMLLKNEKTSGTFHS